MSGKGDFLARMAAASAERAAALDGSVLARAANAAPSVPLRLADDGFDLIAELKRRSPAEGDLAGSAMPLAEQVGGYAEGGAAVISVLTEPSEFHGSLDHLSEVVEVASPVPVMRKDFLVDPLQLAEARAHGASGALLIAGILSSAQLGEMLAAAREQDLFVLLEIFDLAELDMAVAALEAAGPAVDAQGRVHQLFGVNCRDLRTLQIDFARFAEYARHLPEGYATVAESGLTDYAQAAELKNLGYRAALVGTTLMRSGAPREAVEAILKHGRGA